MQIIPELSAPVGFVYAWKRYSLLGERDADSLVSMAKAGWACVPQERHPEVNSEQMNCIVVGGLILVERPSELEAEERRAATKAADDAYNYYAERLEAAIGDGSRVPRSVNGVVVYPKYDKSYTGHH